MKKMLPLMLAVFLVQALWGHGIAEADKQAMIEGGNLRYLWLGAVHMITGYDHLLFLFGVIFYLTGLKDIVRLVTAFTIGHSITLVFATYTHITANYYLVDAVIALSVCYKAFDNLDGFRKYLKIKSPPMLPMILVFGLIHGFGLSTRLQQLPLPEKGLIFRILSFNAGVELGQVAALSVLGALLAGWRKTGSSKTLGGFANFLLLLAGLGLFSFQMTHYLRGTHHHEEGHGDHDHDGEPHEHDQDHGHDLEPEEDAQEGIGVLKATDTSAAADSVKHTHSHGKGVHKHTHTH